MSIRHTQTWIRLGLFLLMLYCFLAAIELFGDAIEMVGHETAQDLFRGLRNPFAGLAVGILATVLVQSSSVTTSTVVAMVGAPVVVAGASGPDPLPLAYAVPMIMGANIGTSITNTLVAMGHVTRGHEFRRAFAGATVHDLFNLLTVLILFPLELATGYLQKSAEYLVALLPLQNAGGGFKSPIKASVKWLAGNVESVLHDGLRIPEGPLLAATLFFVALVVVIASLVVITKNMKVLMADHIEEWLNRVLKRSGMLGLLIGVFMTMLVQSSSITTSLLVPMFGAGILTIEAGFPIMLGANIGTTITALLAASVTGPAGLTIALVHLLFNLSGTLLFLPLRFMRQIPIWLAEHLADLAVRNRIWVAVYVLGTFIVAPLLGILIWK